MDTIWTNGKFITGDVSYPECQALYSKNGVIMAMGSDDEILALNSSGNAIVEDLGGRYVFPGFVDSHMHLLEFAQQDSMIHLNDAKSFADVAELCRSRLDWARESGKWISAIGFNQDDWDVCKLPTRRDLDTISTDVPITIRRSCLHISVCNTRAMEEMGFLDNPPKDGAGNFDRYEDGTLNGIIREMSQMLIFESFPPLSKDDIKALIVRGCNKAAAKGIVEIQTDDFHSTPNDHGEVIMEAYRELAESGELPIRIYEQCYLSNEDGLDIFLAEGHHTGEDHGLFRIGPLKIVMDGSLGSHSAYMRKPYANDPSTRGIAYYEKDELNSYIKKAHDAGLQIAVHCIGDAALEDVLDAFEKAQWENPRTDCRHGIVHCQIMDKAQQDRFKKLGIMGYVQPIFLRCDMNIADECVGINLASQSYNWRQFLDQGVHISGGSDCPVESFDIMPNIQYAVTRKNFETGKSWYPENAMTAKEAVKVFTYEGAYASFSERTRGTLSIGKEADMAVLDNNPLTVPAENIDKIQVFQTVVKGKTVFKSN